jgi:hypothetical protein
LRPIFFRFVSGSFFPQVSVFNNFSALFFKKGILFVPFVSFVPEIAAHRHWKKTTTLAHKSQAKWPLCGCQKASLKPSPALRRHSDPAEREKNLLLNDENVLRNGQKQIPRLPARAGLLGMTGGAEIDF